MWKYAIFAMYNVDMQKCKKLIMHICKWQIGNHVFMQSCNE